MRKFFKTKKIKKIKNIKDIEKVNLFIPLLVNTLECAEKEKNIILDGKKSPWTLGLIQDVVISEISELLSYAKNGEIYFRYGKRQRLLESTYFLSDIRALKHTDLGESISKVQRLYNTF